MSGTVSEAPTGRGASARVAAAIGWLREIYRSARWGAHRLRRAPEYRPLRWVLFLGVLARLILIPLTSWGVDTPAFVLSVVSLLYTGSPYSSTLFFNPPLAPFLQAPTIWIVSTFLPGTALVPVVPAVSPAAATTGFVSPLVPSVAALVALKLPLLAADVGSTLVLFHLVRGSRGLPYAGPIAAAWFLNPILIWTSAVHGEVDGLAALFVLLLLWALLRQNALAAGACLALATFAKFYPILLAPLVVAAFLASPPGPATGERPSRRRQLGLLGAGAAVGSLPFVIYAPELWSILTTSATVTRYGGLSLLVVYNHASPTYGWLATTPLGNGGSALLLLFRVLAVAAAFGSAALLLWRSYRRVDRGSPFRIELLAPAMLWVVSGAVLSTAAPQPENVIGPLALLLVLPILGRSTRLAYFALSAAAFTLYLALSGPGSFFYPLARALGPWAVTALNASVIDYWKLPGPITPGFLWEVSGLVGGVALLAVWILAARATIRSSPKPEVRTHGSPAAPQQTL
jgi:hypothetical protein